MKVSRAAIPDQQDIVNALNNGPSFPATVSFDVRWRGAMGKMMKMKDVRNTQQKFAIQIMETSSTIDWQADRGDLKLVYSFVGRERNGAFF